uniref:Secreted protein n=1 Tax=Pseudictyota dubia TaxID=2749911 RepID=A0A7R9WAR0_9STRA
MMIHYPVVSCPLAFFSWAMYTVSDTSTDVILANGTKAAAFLPNLPRTTVNSAVVSASSPSVAMKYTPLWAGWNFFGRGRKTCCIGWNMWPGRCPSRREVRREVRAQSRRTLHLPDALAAIQGCLCDLDTVSHLGIVASPGADAGSRWKRLEELDEAQR